MPVRKKHLQRSANLDLDHLGALLPTTALQISPRIFHGDYAADSGLVLFGRSCSVGLIA